MRLPDVMPADPRLSPFREHPPSAPAAELEPAGVRSGTPLLQARIKDLRLKLSGTPLERALHELHRELESHGVSLRPACYLSDQWGCPSGVPVIGVPFYLASPNLQRLEGELGGGVETEQEIKMYLRHEAGHCFNYAYRLYDTPEWRELFGDYDAPYKEDFKPKPFSRKYVVHIPGWYAQKHPDEDFAETFAVWLTPDLDWRKRYRSWPNALKKLEFVDALVQRMGRSAPLVQVAEPDLEADQMEETVGDYYRHRDLDEQVDLELGESLDQVLWQLFESGKEGIAADGLLGEARQLLIPSVAQYAGIPRAVVRSLLDHLQLRAKVLGLTTPTEDKSATLARVTALLSTLAMTYLYTGRFLDPEDPAGPSAGPSRLDS